MFQEQSGNRRISDTIPFVVPFLQNFLVTCQLMRKSANGWAKMMKKLLPVVLFLIASGGTPLPGYAVATVTAPAFTVALFPYGRVCATRMGSCRITLRPIKTQCFCGRIPGLVR